MSDRQKSFWASVFRWAGVAGIICIAGILFRTGVIANQVENRLANHETRILSIETTGGTVFERHVAVDSESKGRTDDRFKRIEAATAGLPEMQTDIKLILQRLDQQQPRK